MGLIKAALGAGGGVLADQWKEIFYCSAMTDGVLARKGQKKTSKRSSNTKGDENVITSGSLVEVNEGQCAIIVENGEIRELCAVPGRFEYKNDVAPTIFEGNLGQSIKKSFQDFAQRFTFGGEAVAIQKIYYINLLPVDKNLFGTANPVPFRVVDNNIGLDIDISVRCNGEYSYIISDPMVFFKKVCANFDDEFTRTKIDSIMKTELLTVLQPSFAKISEMGIRYSAVPGHTMELKDVLNEYLTKQWKELRGIEIYSLGINSITASPEDEKMIKDLQRSAVMRNPNMAGAYTVTASADAMRAAASNTNGAVNAFMGMGMVNNMGMNNNAMGFFQMGQQQAQQQPQVQQAQPQAQQAQPQAQASGGWKCGCGAVNTGKFCVECGKPKPAEDGWTCSCGAVNKGKFCMECGAKKPAAEPLYRCDKCGWVPKDPKNPPKFCPECGDVFDANDIQ